MSSNQPLNISDGLELSQILPDAQRIGASCLRFRSACGRSSECEAGDLFVAINDQNGDGHDLVSVAVERGAVGVVTERLLPVSIPQFVVSDSRIAYGQVCHALAGDPSERLSTIGIGGSAGKTVTAHLIHSILSLAGKSAGLSSSIESRIGDSQAGIPLNGSSPTLANELSRMVLSNCSHAILEASSVDLAQRRLSGIQWDAAVVTNSYPSNLSYHGTLENYQNALSQLLKAVRSTGFAVINADDKYCSKLLDLVQVPTLTYGIHRTAEISAKLLERNASFQTFMLVVGNETAVVRTSIIGKQHIYNCLAATAVGLAIGIELRVIIRALESVKIPGRLERLDFGQEFGVWIDSSLTPIHLNGAIAALGQVCDGRLWCICSTDRSQTGDDRRQLGAILERKTENPIVTQSVSSESIDYEPAHQVLDGFDNPALAHVMPNRIQAIEWVLSKAKPNDVVLIAGAGEKPIAFADASNSAVTDRDICAACLQDLPNGSKRTRPEIFRIDEYR